MDFKKLVKPYQKDLLKSVERFVKIPSVYDAKSVTESTPYGKNVEKALKEFIKFGKEHNFKIESHPRYVELSIGKGPVIGIYGHLDVVPVTNNKLFKMRIANNNLYGRGVADDKGPLFAAIYAVLALRDKGLIKNKTIKIFAGGDEERGSSCLTYYANTHKAPLFGFTPDSDFPVIYGEKGTSGMVVSKNIKLKNIIEIKGGVASNVVIGEATFKVNNINKIKNKIKAKHKIKGNEITFIGRSAHGSLPHLGKNAFLIGLKELSTINNDKLGIKIADAFLDYTGKKLNCYYRSKDLGNITFSVGLVNYKNNKLTFSVDVRVPNNITHQAIVNKVLKSFNFKLVKDSHHDPLLFNKKSPLVSLLMDAYKKETGQYKSEPIYSGGGTYAKEINNTVAFGAMYPNRNYFMHEEHEYIPLKDLFKTMSVYAHAIYNLINYKK